MSLTSALSNALSGLNTGARLAEMTSENISNSLNEGYAKRQAQLSSRLVGGFGAGVRVLSIERQVNKALVQDLRLSGAESSALSPGFKTLKTIETAIGNPSDGSSLVGRLASLERSLVEAATKPESEVLLLRARDAASNLVTGLHDVSARISEARQSADAAIAKEVAALNATLKSVRDLNLQITAMTARGQDTSAAEDQRQKLVDQISTLVPVRELAREGNQIALFTTTGVTLLDGRATVFSFEPKAIIGAGDTIQNGALSGLSADGKPVSTNPDGGRLGQGKLSALFEVRDEMTIGLQGSIDTIARSMIERLSGPAVDPTLATGETGLFVDGTPPGLPLDAPGLASRIALNPAILGDGAGQIWKLRDGIHSNLDLSRADPSLLQAISRQLASNLPVPGNAAAPAASLAGLISKAVSEVASQRVSTEATISFATAKSQALKAELLKDGVDTDQEMQSLMQIEKAYAANARVIQTIDDMLRNLLEI